jgi:hypothetical protein
VSSHSYYQALSEQSRLFRKLCDEPAFYVLFAELTILGPGPFHLAALDPGEVESTLDWLTERRTFGSRAAADRTLKDLRHEVESAVTAYPGIDGRGAYFEQVEEDLESLLAQVLTRTACVRAESLAATLLQGEAPLAAGGGNLSGSPFRLVPTPVVREGARALRTLPAEVLAEEATDWEFPSEDYELWRAVYREAADRGEAILVLRV